MVWLRMALIVPLIALNTLVHCVPLLSVALFKAVFSSDRMRVKCNPLLTGLAESWIGANSWMISTFTSTQFNVQEMAPVRADGHYLVLANHQSWVDILVLQKVFNKRIPLLRFFLKRQLFWVPILGLAWWALDFPFMGRYTRKEIARNPELGRRDREVTRKACEKFRSIPIAVMNFVEGTRFTQQKHDAQNSPYKHLLKPKSGGVAFVLDAMGDGLHGILDITIAYPGGRPSMADLIGNRVPQVDVLVRQRPLPADVMGGSYEEDREYRARFQQWMNTLWSQKDADLAALLSQQPVDKL